MQLHANAKLGPAGRLSLCQAIEGGLTLKVAAAAFGVAPATAHRWWHRWQALQSPACLLDRSSRPHRQPRRLSAAEEEPILRARRQTNLGPGRLAGIVQRSRSTIWKVLHRHRLSRRPKAQRQTYRRYQWSRPGALLHPPEAIMTDNAFVYTKSYRFAEILRRIGARHITPPRYTPRWNGKVERFTQTLQNEWAYAHLWPNSTARARAQSSFIRYHNRRRPTARSETGRPSAAFTTSVGRTANAGTSSGCANARSIASRLRNMRRLRSSMA